MTRVKEELIALFGVAAVIAIAMGLVTMNYSHIVIGILIFIVIFVDGIIIYKGMKKEKKELKPMQAI